MKNLRLFGIALFGFSLLSDAPASAGFLPELNKKTDICSALLKTLAERGHIGTLAQQNTGEAVTVLRKFRLHDLDMNDVEGSYESIGTVESHSSDPLKVGDRIRGVEIYFRENGSSTIEDKWISGFTLKGKSQIQAYFDAKNQTLKKIKDSYSGIMKSAHSFVALVAAGSAWYTTQAFTHGLAQEPKNIPYIVIGLLGSMPDLPFRYWNSYDFGYRKSEDIFQKSLDRAEPESWVYDSSDTPIREATVKALMENYQYNPFTEIEISNAADRAVDPWIYRVIDQAIHQKDIHKETWVLADHLLKFDNQGEPTLAVMIRSSHEKPKIPKPERETQTETETVTEKTPALSPVYLPTPKSGSRNRD